MIIGNEKSIRFGQIFDSVCSRKSVRAHNTIQNAIGTQLQEMGFEVIYEFQDVDEDSSYRYDIIAQKKKELWIVEVKDVIDIRNFGQIEAYCLQVKKENPNAVVWLGTDCLNFWRLTQGEVGQMMQRLMKTENLGIILINPARYWLLPEHKDLLSIEEEGHLCVDCPYAKAFNCNGAALKILSTIEDGKKELPKTTKADKEKEYTFTPDDFKDILKDFKKIKSKMTGKVFEERYGIKLK